MIHLNEIQCVIITYNEPATRELQLWLRSIGIDWYYSPGSYEIDVAKNQIVSKFLEKDVPKGKNYLFCIANDMIPLKTTVNILTTEGPLLYCRSLGNEGKMDHVGDYNFSSACFRVHKNVLTAFGPPWFSMGHSGDKTRQTFCDCIYFKDRANESGYDGKVCGDVGHEQRCILMPHESDSQKWQMMWPSAWNEKEICTPIEPILQESLNQVWRGLGTPMPVKTTETTALNTEDSIEDNIE